MAEYVYERMAGILVKTQLRYAETFLRHWERTQRPQVFCIYNRRPYLKPGDTVFCHAVKVNKLVFSAEFIKSEWVRAFRGVEPEERRLQERERIWRLYGDSQLHVDDKAEFDAFWDKWDGVRSLIMIKSLRRIERTVTWDDIRRKVLYTNFPHGVGYYYLSESDVKALFKLIGRTKTTLEI